MAWTLRALMKRSACHAVPFVLGTALVLSGCRQQQTESVSTAADPSASVDNPEAPGTGAQGGVTTNEASTIAYGLGKKLQDGAFAAADPALKESYARALIAYDIGDYGRAFTELNDMSAGGELNQPQIQAVNELRAKTLAAAPALATNNPAAGAGTTFQPDTFALAAENQPPFSTADAAVRETYDRAKAAYDIGNFEVAAAELQDLVTNAQLNWQQKYAAQSLLDKTPRPVPGTK